MNCWAYIAVNTDIKNTVKSFSDRSFCSDLFLWMAEHINLNTNSRLLLAVSGGLDSMVLLDFFQRFGLRKYHLYWGVAHFDHGLRAESAADAQWLKKLCEQRGIPYWQGRLNPDKHLMNTYSEAFLREHRYRWLFALCREQGFTHLATGHHASDQAEGIMMRLIRGGIAGLGGMPPTSHREACTLIRPLLNLPRSALAAYAHYHDLDWREDASNSEPCFFRNRLRQHVLPLLRQENPDLDRHFNEHALFWQAEQDFLNQLAQQTLTDLSSLSPERITLPVKPFRRIHPALQRLVLKLALKHLCQDNWKIFSSRHLEALRKLSESGRGKQLDLPCQIRAVREQDELVLYLGEHGNL
jgi:tRNA(Ile)-lysidine synthetase-like protein